MKSFLIKSAVVLLFGVTIFGNVNAQNFNANLAAKLQQTLDTQLAAFPDTKGVSASVYYPGQGIWKGTSGISYAGHPITSDMEFGIASNTKLFTAVAVMKLVENNILNLSDQLHEWLPKYNNVDSSVTIRQLLNHTSGIADVFTNASMAFIAANPAHQFTTAEVMAYVGPKLFNKGTGYGYSNTNYVLAGMIIESATGQSVSTIIRDSILTPLQLDSTFYDGQETVLGTIAHPWQNGVDGINISRTALNTLGRSSGSMYSTAGEMAQWYQALLSGQVVSANSLTEITTFLSPGNYGFAFLKMSLFGRTVWGHGGVNTGYKSRMFYDPEMKATVCGLSNSNQSAIDGAITGMLLKTLLDYLPASAGAITGTTTVCQGQTSVTYSVSAITNATSYLWELPSGATGTSATNSITVNYGAAAVSGNITVVGANAYGNGVPSTKQITVNPVPAVTVSGVVDVQVNSIQQYSIQQIPGTITWSVSGGIITSGQGTNQVTVSWGAAGAGSIEAAVLLPNGCTTSQSLAVTKYEPVTGVSLALWLDASKIIGVNNGQQLPFTAPFNEAHASWQDVSGNGRGAYMVGGNQILIPTYYNSGLNTVNGLPGVTFDQVNDALIVNNSAAINAGTAKTLFSVFKTGADINANQVIFESGSGAAAHSGFNIYIYGSQIGFGVWNGNNAVWINKPCQPNTSYLTQLVYDGSAGTLKVSVNNQTAITNGVTPTLPQGTQYNGVGSAVQGTRMWMGYSNSTIAFPFGGSIAEVMLYNTVSPAVRSQTFSYLNAKYGFALGANQLLKSSDVESSESDFEIKEGSYNVDISSDEYTAPVQTIRTVVTPNPVQDEARIRIQSDKSAEVEIAVYDILGQQIILPIKGELREGLNEFTIHTKDVMTGSYRVVVSGTNVYESAVMVIVK